MIDAHSHMLMDGGLPLTGAEADGIPGGNARRLLKLG